MIRAPWFTFRQPGGRLFNVLVGFTDDAPVYLPLIETGSGGSGVYIAINTMKGAGVLALLKYPPYVIIKRIGQDEMDITEV